MMVDTYLAAALDCVDYFYARMFRDWPEAVSRRANDFTLSYSGAPRLTGANHLWPHTPGALTAPALAEALDFFAPYDAAWSVIYTDTFMPNAASFLQQHGYFRRWSSPLMVLDGPPRPLPRHPGAHVQRASTPQHIDDVRRIMAEAFLTENDVNARVARMSHLDDPFITHYLVYAQDEPAACATAALHGPIAGIWNVGTRYRFRRQRYATTIMLALLDDLSARGCPASMLMASAEGFPLYAQLGYRQIGQTYYMAPPYAAPPRLPFT